jgi:uncharacterized OB-fold protein
LVSCVKGPCDLQNRAAVRPPAAKAPALRTEDGDELQVVGEPLMESIAASRCPRCGTVVAPPARSCPHDPVAMEPVSLPGVGEVVSFTTLHSPPEGFRSPLTLVLVQLEGGARFFCHGADSRRLRIGSREAIDSVYYFSHLGTLDRARLFWRRTGRAGDRVNAITRSVMKRMGKGRTRGEG